MNSHLIPHLWINIWTDWVLCPWYTTNLVKTKVRIPTYCTPLENWTVTQKMTNTKMKEHFENLMSLDLQQKTPNTDLVKIQYVLQLPVVVLLQLLLLIIIIVKTIMMRMLNSFFVLMLSNASSCCDLHIK